MLPDPVYRLRTDGALNLWPCQMFYGDLEYMTVMHLSVKCRFI